MRNIWLRIGLGAGGVFAVGMIIVTVGRFGRAKIEDLVHSDSDIRIPLMGIVPFQLADQRLGDLRRLTLLRDAPDHLKGVRVEVRLADSASLDGVKECAFLSVNDPEHLNENTRFECIQDTMGLTGFGTVEIKHQQGGEPTTLVRTLVLPDAQVRQLQQAMGPRVHPDAARIAELQRMGDSLEGMGDSIAAATQIQVRIATEQARNAGRYRGNTSVTVAPDAPTPPVAPGPVLPPTVVVVAGEGRFDLVISGARGQRLVSRQNVAAPLETPWPVGATQVEITIRSQSEAHPLRGELVTQDRHSGTSVTNAGAGGTNQILLRYVTEGSVKHYTAQGS